MAHNPLYPTSSDRPGPATHHSRALHDSRTPHHTPDSKPAAERQAAADLIRQKIDKLYASEPNAAQEAREVAGSQPPRSKHQQFMYELSASGRGLAEIQTAWHQYYSELPDDEKHAVWQEFYNNSSQLRQGNEHAGQAASSPAKPIYPEATALEKPPVKTAAQRNPLIPVPSTTPETPGKPGITVGQAASGAPLPEAAPGHQPSPVQSFDHSQAADSHAKTFGGFGSKNGRSPAEIKKQLLETISNRGTLTPKHHLQSLLFGLGFGSLVLVVVLFSFFNEVIIAPFIQPSRNVSATPIIVASDGSATSDKNEVIIPKINLEIPLDFSVTSTNEAQVETALENGIVHYPTTVLPGQKGNTAFFGHSSNNIFNPGKYKFAFVLLHELVPGDTFYLTRDGVSYAYQVFDKKIVKPTDVHVLNTVEGKTATATLITCDPPGTSINRLVVWGEQISPNPSNNQTATSVPASANAGTDNKSQPLPGNGPTLWHRLTDWIF